MNNHHFRIDDFERIFFGMAPPGYLLETAVRVAILYVVILLAIRIMGKRMTSQLGGNELAAKVALGAAVGMSMVRPGRGMLLSVLIVIIIVIVGRFISDRMYFSKKFERAFNGTASLLAINGILNNNELKKANLSKGRVFAAMRQQGIRHLGEVDKFYIEANGEFSLLKNPEPKPGLAVIPEWDNALRERMKKIGSKFCITCGSEIGTEFHACRCGCEKWEEGML